MTENPLTKGIMMGRSIMIMIIIISIIVFNIIMIQYRTFKSALNNVDSICMACTVQRHIGVYTVTGSYTTC